MSTRSLCTVVCKWTFLGHKKQWDETYFQQIGLDDLTLGNFAKLGNDVRSVGDRVGCLTSQVGRFLVCVLFVILMLCAVAPSSQQWSLG